MDERKTELTEVAGVHIARTTPGAEVVSVDGNSVVLLPGGGAMPVGGTLPGQVFTASAPQPTIIVISQGEKKEEKKDDKKKKKPKAVSEVFKSL